MTGFKNETTSRFSFYILFSFLIFLLFLKYVLLIALPSIVFISVFAVIAMFGNRDEILASCICCIPFYTALPYYYAVAICLIVYLLKYGKDIKLDFGFIPIVLIVVWELLHCFGDEISINSVIISAIPYLLFVILFFISGIKSVDYSFIVKVFAISVLSVCLILTGRLIILSDFNFNVAFFNMQRLGLNDEDIGGLIMNPNTLGILCVLAVSCLMQLRLKGQKNVSDLILMISIIVLGSLTVSRTYLVCLIIVLVYVFIASKGGIKKKIALLFGGVLIFVVSILLLNTLFPIVLELFGERLNAEDISSGRSYLFADYNNYIFSSAKSLFWGVGTSDFFHKLVNVYLISDNVPHNGIQEVVVAWGVPGLLFFIAMICVMVRRSREENTNQRLLNYLPFVVLLAKIQVGQMITSSYTLLAFALIYISLCADLTHVSD